MQDHCGPPAGSLVACTMRRLSLLSPLLLAACTSVAVGPSLSKRPVESVPLTEPQVQTPLPPPADSEALARISTLLTQVREGQNAFAAILPRARQAAAAAGTEASESWITAQQLLSAAESARAPSTRALGELDMLIAARVYEGSDVGLIELQAAQVEAAGLVEEQQRAIDALRERISG